MRIGGAPKLLGPLGTPQEDAPGCKASSSISVPDCSLSAFPACPGAVGSRKPYGWREEGESGPLAPMSIVLDGNLATLTQLAGSVIAKEGKSQECLQSVTAKSSQALGSQDQGASST